MRRFTGPLSFFTFAVQCVPAAACPLCDSATGQQVRAGIFNKDFTQHLLLTAAPFPILAAIIGLIYLGAPSWKTTARAPDNGSDLDN